MIGSLCKNHGNKNRRDGKNQERVQITWCLIESRKCEEEKRVKDRTIGRRWCCALRQQYWKSSKLELHRE